MPSKDFEWVGCWMTPWNTLYAPLRISKALILCPQTCRGSKEGGKEGGEEGGKGGTYRANKCRVWAVGWAMTYCTHLSGFWDCTHGQWGSRAAGQQGSRAAGQQGSRAVGQWGSGAVGHMVTVGSKMQQTMWELHVGYGLSYKDQQRK